ncbi:hypothetical protein JTB14_006353 [Gonioctena quinquepunctata]|nr:hypothetical protein JTB14_006353 [Gonioctena quinquepunctata]
MLRVQRQIFIHSASTNPTQKNADPFKKEFNLEVSLTVHSRRHYRERIERETDITGRSERGEKNLQKATIGGNKLNVEDKIYSAAEIQSILSNREKEFPVISTRQILSEPPTSSPKEFEIEEEETVIRLKTLIETELEEAKHRSQGRTEKEEHKIKPSKMRQLSVNDPPKNHSTITRTMRSSKCTIHRQYIPNKPAKYGLKIQALVDSRSFYVLNMEIYAGEQPAVPPDIDDSGTSGDITIREGENVTLTCSATGHPQPRILWRREDGEHLIIEDGSQKVETSRGSTLRLVRVDRRQMGAYLCIASNDVPPAVSKRITLHITCEYTILFVTSNVYVWHCFIDEFCTNQNEALR